MLHVARQPKKGYLYARGVALLGQMKAHYNAAFEQRAESTLYAYAPAISDYFYVHFIRALPFFQRWRRERAARVRDDVLT